MRGLAAAALALTAVWCGCAGAQEGGWAVTGAFADVPPGARGTALAGALGACVDDATAVHWNPARLVELAGSAAAVSYADLFGLGLVRQTALHLAFLRRERALGWDAGRFQSRPGEASHALGLGLRATSVDLEAESYDEYDFALAYAHRGAWGVRWGVAGHALLVRSSLADVGASGFSADVALSRTWGRFDGALVMRSLISQLGWDNGASERLRPTLQLAGALRLARQLTLPAALLWDLDAARATQASLGAEWGPRGDTLLLRGGLRWRDDGHEAALHGSLGAGLRWEGLRFDYGLALERDELGDTHRFSVHYQF